MSDLPGSWRLSTLGEVALVLDSRRIPLNARERHARQGPFPYYGANGQVGTIDSFLFEGDHILLAEDGGYFDDPNRPNAYAVGGRFWVNNHAHILAATDGVLLRFLLHLLNATDLMPYVSGTTRLKLTQADMRRIPVPLPPLAEQRRIVARIDALFARTRRARVDLERIAPLSDRHRLAQLRAAVTGQLTEAWRQTRRTTDDIKIALRRIPAPEQGRGGREATTNITPGVAGLSVNDPGTPAPLGWAWTPLLRIARQESGHTPSRRVPAYWDNGDVPWVGIRDAGAHHGSTIYDTAQKCTRLGLENSSARLLPAGTVCLSRTASVGYVTVLGKPMATSQDFATWTCTPALLPEYLKFALLAEGDEIRRFGEGSTHTTIYFPEIRALHICLPPIDEQAEVVRILTSNAGGQTVASNEAVRALALLDRLEQSILARAFRGELVQQDPAYLLQEPAPAFERVASAGPRRGRRVAA